MEEESKQVAEKIESGTYFSEALKWYNARYIFVQTQFSQMFIVGMASLVAFLLTFGAFVGFLPVIDKRLFVVYHSIEPDTYINIRGLMALGEDPNYALARYYAEKYVISREEYVTKYTEANFNMVYSMSSDEVLDDYLTSVSPDNPNSPFVIYSNRGKRDVQIMDIKFLNKEGKQIYLAEPKGRVLVNFLAQEDFGAAGQNTQEYVADIEFDFTPLSVNQETEQLTQEPKMVITNYTTKLDNGNTGSKK